MKNKILVLLLLPYITIISCKSIEVANEKSFNNEFFNNSSIVYNLNKYSLGNEINIYDSKKLMTNKTLVFKNNDTTINIFSNKNNFLDYSLQQYTVNKDLAFIVFWKNGENKALWFLLSKGKKTKKWYLVEVLERTIK